MERDFEFHVWERMLLFLSLIQLVHNSQSYLCTFPAGSYIVCIAFNCIVGTSTVHAVQILKYASRKTVKLAVID
jgi:hypothetical protein